MGKATLFDNLREWVSGIAFSVLLWAYRLSEDEYRRAMYQNIKAELEENDLPR
jgi:hypothetical protein